MHIIPIEILSRSLSLGDGGLKDGQVAVPAALLRHLIECALRAVPFDEDAYLTANPDVAFAVDRAGPHMAREHYVTTGYFEGREGAASAFDEAWYLRCNPDVAEAVQAGVWSSGQAHYRAEGKYEWRSPNAALVDQIDRWRRCFLS
jgi:hypothetical protein